jgi:hypothetical protein
MNFAAAEQRRKGAVMSHSDYRTLLNRGRRAGLKTSELYLVLSTRPPEGAGQILGQTDSNGFVSGYDQRGQQVYRPVGHFPRS